MLASKNKKQIVSDTWNTSLVDGLEIKSLMRQDYKESNELVTTNYHSSETQQPLIQSIPSIRTLNEDVSHQMSRIIKLRTEKFTLDHTFDSCIKKLEKELSRQEEINKQLKGQIDYMKSDINDTYRDVNILKKYVNRNSIQKSMEDKEKKSEVIQSPKLRLKRQGHSKLFNKPYPI